jgi:hypothetical protein
LTEKLTRDEFEDYKKHYKGISNDSWWG